MEDIWDAVGKGLIEASTSVFEVKKKGQKSWIAESLGNSLKKANS